MQMRKVSARGDDLLHLKKKKEREKKQTERNGLLIGGGSADRNVREPFERGARFI